MTSVCVFTQRTSLDATPSLDGRTVCGGGGALTEGGLPRHVRPPTVKMAAAVVTCPPTVKMAAAVAL